jgi:hypothetical protein
MGVFPYKLVIGRMGFPYQSVTKTVVGTTAAYATGNVMGNGVQVFNSTPMGGFLQSININLNSSNANQIDFCMFYSSMPNTTFTDHSAVAVSSADFAAIGPIVNVTAWNAMGSNASAGFAGGLAYAFNSNTPPMFWALVARGAITIGSSTGISVTLTYVS